LLYKEIKLLKSSSFFQKLLQFMHFYVTINYEYVTACPFAVIYYIYKAAFARGLQAFWQRARKVQKCRKGVYLRAQTTCITALFKPNDLKRKEGTDEDRKIYDAVDAGGVLRCGNDGHGHYLLYTSGEGQL
ncbi:MAG: hypothetical protein II330_06450, partial [Clostridia bacterium]|nr:hypothetical protein [Clostridia bacterium]